MQSTRLTELIKNINKTMGAPVCTVGIPEIDCEKIPFTSPRANYMLYGGIPRGRLVEFKGEENGGKTTSALDIVANAQALFYKEYKQEVESLESQEKLTKEKQLRLTTLKAEGALKIAYWDCENTLDEKWAELIGVDTSSLVVLKPKTHTAEQIFDMILDMLKSNMFGLIVIDSLGVLLSKQAYEKSVDEKTYGGISQPLTRFSKEAEGLCALTNCTIIGINQLREKMDSSYGGTTSVGGRAWRHNVSLRIDFKKGDYIDNRGVSLKRSAESPNGNLVLMHVEKTKFCKPDRKVGFFTLYYDTGIGVVDDTIDMCIKEGVILQAGSWFSVIDKSTGEILSDENFGQLKFQGRPDLVSFFKENDNWLEVVNNQIK